MTEVDTEDYLEVDTELPNQRFVVLSFISPENVLMKKELYFQSEFLKWLCVQSEFLENNVLKNNEGKTQLNYTNVKEKYDDFMFNNEEQLENQFHEMSDFKTSVRGVKVRGVYGSHREAEVRSKVLQKLHNFLLYIRILSMNLSLQFKNILTKIMIIDFQVVYLKVDF
jgi:hypothetical protein